MSYYHDDSITSDGFTCSYGRLFAHPGRVERVEGSSLRSMFLPRLNSEGNKRLRHCNSDDFVRGQLKHYGVQFYESDISGNGTLLLKKVLQAGKCDKDDVDSDRKPTTGSKRKAGAPRGRGRPPKNRRLELPNHVHIY